MSTAMQTITRTFPSATTDAVHTATFAPDTGTVNCSCPGWRKGHRCWHTRELSERFCATPCPDCGGVVELVTDGTIDGRPRPFGACTTCEFCIAV